LSLISSQKLVKKFGESPIFIASTQLVDGETLKHGGIASQLTEAIHVISCGYEEKTEWGKEVNYLFPLLFYSKTCSMNILIYTHLSYKRLGISYFYNKNKL